MHANVHQLTKYRRRSNGCDQTRDEQELNHCSVAASRGKLAIFALTFYLHDNSLDYCDLPEEKWATTTTAATVVSRCLYSNIISRKPDHDFLFAFNLRLRSINDHLWPIDDGGSSVSAARGQASQTESTIISRSPILSLSSVGHLAKNAMRCVKYGNDHFTGFRSPKGHSSPLDISHRTPL